MAFTKRLGDCYLRRSIKKGSIVVPKDFAIEDKALFIFDDLTPLGIAYPKELVDVLAQNNQPTVVYDAQNLAAKLAKILPPAYINILSGGGILAYLFLKRAGWAGMASDVIGVERRYVNGRPECKLVGRSPLWPQSLLLDDIVASGQTIGSALRWARKDVVNVACLLASSNIPQGGNKCRERQKSSICGVNKLYCAQLVNGVRRRKDFQEKPAILSLRYLVTKAVDAQDYTQTYLVKKFGGQENANRILSLIKGIDREPLDILRRDKCVFFERYVGGECKFAIGEEE